MAHEWLAAVAFQLVFRAAGVDGLILAKALLIGLTALFLWAAGRAAGARVEILLPALGLGLFVAASRFQVRPHLFTWLFTAVFLWAWMRYRRGGRHAGWLLALAPLQVLWANTHGGGIVGLGLLGIILAGEGLEAAAEGIRPLRRRLLAPAGALAAGAAASLLNPYGLRTLLLPFRLTSMNLYMERIFEWQPPHHASFRDTTMMAGWILLSSATAFFLLRGGAVRRSGPSGGSALIALGPPAVLALFLVLRTLDGGLWGAPAARLLLAALPALLAAGILTRFRQADLPLHLLALAFMVLALRHHRNVSDAALVCALVLAVTASRVLPDRQASSSPRRRAAAAVPVAALAAAAVAVALFGYPYRAEGSVRKAGLGLGPDTPACAVEFAATHGLRGNAFVSYRDAAMLIHRLHPEVRVNIDSRNDVYGEDLYRRYLGALRSPAAMESFLQAWPVDFILLGYGDVDPAVGGWLTGPGGWAPVFFDSRSFILVPRDRLSDPVLAGEAYRVLRPSVLGSTAITPANAAVALQEADRSIRRCHGSTFGYFYRGKALMELGRYREALETGRAAVALDPGNATAWADMGLAAAALGDRAEAVRCYRRALEADPANQVARRNLEILGSP